MALRSPVGVAGTEAQGHRLSLEATATRWGCECLWREFCADAWHDSRPAEQSETARLTGPILGPRGRRTAKPAGCPAAKPTSLSLCPTEDLELSLACSSSICSAVAFMVRHCRVSVGGDMVSWGKARAAEPWPGREISTPPFFAKTGGYKTWAHLLQGSLGALPAGPVRESAARLGGL